MDNNRRWNLHRTENWNGAAASDPVDRAAIQTAFVDKHRRL
jgi:hypothetical protein